MSGSAGRQLRERSGQRLAARARAQEQLATQLALPASREGFARALADAARLVVPCAVRARYRFHGHELAGLPARRDDPAATTPQRSA